jgi:hypothetical protein
MAEDQYYSTLSSRGTELRVFKRGDIRSGVFVVSFVIALTTLIIAHGGLSAEKPPRESEACLDCHDDLLETLNNTPHQILADKAVDQAAVACTDCHPGDVTTSRIWRSGIRTRKTEWAASIVTRFTERSGPGC